MEDGIKTFVMISVYSFLFTRHSSFSIKLVFSINR